MKGEENMNDALEKIIRETLTGKPRPKLPADFTASVMERVEQADQKRGLSRSAAIVLSAYWLVVLVISGFIFAGIKWPLWFPIVFLAMTPFVFLAAAAPRGLHRLGARILGPII
jgi:hypothetical protein